MGLAAAALGWSAGQCWAATPHEMTDALDGWRRINTVKKDD